MILTLTPTKYFPSDTVFLITIPTYWPKNALNTSFNQIINSTIQPTCLPISTNVQSSITCTLSSTSVITVSVSNLFLSDTSQSISFSLSKIRNPPTVESQGALEIISQRGVNSMEKCSMVQMTGITSGQLDGATFAMDSTQVGS